jgi:hypothetical protein
MKTYTVWAEIEEFDSDTGVHCDAMGMPEMIGPFATLKAAQRFLTSLPIEPRGRPSLDDLGREETRGERASG